MTLSQFSISPFLRTQIAGLLASCALFAIQVTYVHAADSLPLTGPRLLSRISRQPWQTRPASFGRSTKPAAGCQLAIVIDGTTSMSHELVDLSKLFDDLVQLYNSMTGTGELEVALIVYRDAEAASGSVAVVSDFTNISAKLTEALSKLKVETGEPFFPEAMDQGLNAATVNLNWRGTESEMLHRILVIGDAPPYANDHPNRKFHDAKLHDQIAERHIHVDAILVNSGFPVVDDGVIGTSRETAMRAAPYAREFLISLTQKSGGTFTDLWDSAVTARLYEPLVILTGQLLDAPIESTPKSALDPYPTPTLMTWRSALAKQLASVRTERPVLRALSTISTSALKAVDRDPFEQVWNRADLLSAIQDLEEALEEEPDNPLLHLLLANTHSLVARLDAVDEHAQAVVRHSAAAMAGLNEKTPPSVRQEVEALYALYVTDEPEVAKSGFNALSNAEAEMANPGCRLRAAWSLFALELGIWPAAKISKTGDEQVIRDLARRIVKHWPDSFEARTLDTLHRDSLRSGQIEIPKSWFVASRSQ